MASDPSLLTLRDGRTLSYASYGDPTPTAPTIFYFHGFPASRLEGSSWSATAASFSARLIAPDRPGAGASTFQPKRRLLDWPSDVLQLADHLQVSRFYVMGASGGAPYVIACAREIPRSCLLGAAVMSGIYPLKLGVSDMLLTTRAMMFMAAWASPLLVPLLDWQLGRAARNPDPTVFEDMFVKEMDAQSGVDGKCLRDVEFRMQLMQSIRESVRAGSQGAAWEARLYATEWGFELNEVQFDGLCLWHGLLDTNCPVTMAVKAVAQLKGAELKIFQEEAHMSLPVNHATEIMRHLLKRGSEGN